jgi:predicted kinase
MNTTHRLYILCGLPFAGKTTLARTLSERFGYTCIELDRMNYERGLGADGNAIPGQQWGETYQESYRWVDRLLAEGQPVVYDAANFTRAMRDELRQIADRHGVHVQVIYLDVPEHEVRVRWQQNRQAPWRHDVPDEDFHNVTTYFQPPGEDENVLRYNYIQHPPLDEWLQHTLGPVS